MKINFRLCVGSIFFITIKASTTVTLSPPTNMTLCPMHCACEIIDQSRDIIDQSRSLSIDCQQRMDNTTNSIYTEISAILVDMNQLTQLNISYSRMIYLPMEVCELKSLRSLNLDHNQLERLPDNCFTRLTNLVHFSAAFNNISHLQDGLFDGLAYLQRITLNYNNIESIRQNLFTNTTDLHSLSLIQLRYNILRELEPWPFLRALATPNISVDLAHNLITTFTNFIKWNSSCQGERSPNRRQKLYLNLSYNRIDHVVTLVNSLNFNSQADFICWMKEVSLYLGHCPYICDCLDFALYAWANIVKLSDILNNVYCKDRQGLQSVRATYVPINDLVCSVPENCPATCSCVNQPSNSTFHIICTNTEQNDLPISVPNSSFPRSLFMPTTRMSYKLCFANNNISHLRPREFFLNTVYLDLSDSKLQNMSNDAWLQLENVDKIYLHNNLLTNIPTVANISNFKFSVLSLYNNPFWCGCEQVRLKALLISIYTRLENPSAILCDSPPRLKGKSIFTITDTEFCPDPNSGNVDQNSNTKYIWIMLAVVSTLMIAGVCVMFVNLKTFRVKVFSKLGVHRFDADEFDGEEINYDVFLVYALEDTRRARSILGFLERNSYKVCLYQRNFTLGAVLIESVRDAISKSKRVLCLVSDNFLASDFCMAAFEVALCNSNKLKHRRVIVMKSIQFRIPENDSERENFGGDGEEPIISLEPHSSILGSSLVKETMSLKRFIARHTCICYESETWKHQLFYAMPVKRIFASQVEVDTTVQCISTVNDDCDSMLDPGESSENQSTVVQNNNNGVPLLMA